MTRPEVAALVGLTAVAALLLSTLLIANWWHRNRDARLVGLRIDELMHAGEAIRSVIRF